MKVLPKLLQLLVGIIITIVSLKIFLRDVNYHKLLHELLSYSPVSLGIITILSVLPLWFRAIRWRIILPENKLINNNRLFELVSVGFAVNNVFPAKIGEAFRAVMLWRKYGLKLTTAVFSIVLERFLDIFILLSLFFIPLFSISILREHRNLVNIGIITIIMFCVTVIGLFIYARFPKHFHSFVIKCINIVPQKFANKIRNIFEEIIILLNWTSSVQKIISVVVLSLLIELCYVLSVAILLVPFPSLGLLYSMFAVAFASLGEAIPLAPGSVGTVHAMILQAFSLLNYEKEQARAIAIIVHAIPFLVITIIGIITFLRMHISLKDISKAKEEIKSFNNLKEDKVDKNN